MKLTDVDNLLRHLPDDLPYKASVKRVLMQAEEDVVTCKDCTYYNEKVNMCDYRDVEVYDGDFCSWATRRETND